MLSVAILHLFPHSVIELDGNTDLSAVAVLIGILVTFILLRTFHVHQHGSHNEQHVHDHSCNQPEHTHTTASEDPDHCEVHRSRYSWVGLFVGLGIHSIIDGVAISAIVIESSANASGTVLLPGIALVAAILLHKPLDAMSVISVMKSSGWDRKNIRLVNITYAAISPLGIYMAVLGFNIFSGGDSTPLLGWTLGISAGCFLTIALSDILPELTFHSHDRLKLTVALIIGIVLGFILQTAEPSHDHHSPQQVSTISLRHGRNSMRPSETDGPNRPAYDRGSNTLHRQVDGWGNMSISMNRTENLPNGADTYQ